MKKKLSDLLTEHTINQKIFPLFMHQQVIEMHEHPTKALKEKKQSSIAIGFHLLATGKADAFISAGNTGAMMVGALYSIKAIEGVSRPTIGAYIPRENGDLSLFVDVGLNADCKPENLSPICCSGFSICKAHFKFSQSAGSACKSWGRRRQRQYSYTGGLSAFERK